MNIIISLLIIFLSLVSCDLLVNKTTTNREQSNAVFALVSDDSIPNYTPNINSKALHQFLTDPIGIPKFDKNCGANRRVYQKEAYLYEPPKEGIYHRYYVFTECGCKPYDLQVVVYKYKQAEDDKNEEALIKIYGTCETDELKDFALVGQQWNTIRQKYGNNYLKDGMHRIYADKGNLLVLKLNPAGKIISFHYVRTNKQEFRSIDDIPLDLLQ